MFFDLSGKFCQLAIPFCCLTRPFCQLTTLFCYLTSMFFDLSTPFCCLTSMFFNLSASHPEKTLQFGALYGSMYLWDVRLILLSCFLYQLNTMKSLHPGKGGKGPLLIRFPLYRILVCPGMGNSIIPTMHLRGHIRRSGNRCTRFRRRRNRYRGYFRQAAGDAQIVLPGRDWQ
jgi:hypothetical protein